MIGVCRAFAQYLVESLRRNPQLLAEDDRLTESQGIESRDYLVERLNGSSCAYRAYVIYVRTQLFHQRHGLLHRLLFTSNDERQLCLNCPFNASGNRGIQISNPFLHRQSPNVDCSLGSSRGGVQDEGSRRGSREDPPFPHHHLFNLWIKRKGKDNAFALCPNICSRADHLRPLRFKISHFFRMPGVHNQGMARSEDIVGHGFSHRACSNDSNLHDDMPPNMKIRRITHPVSHCQTSFVQRRIRDHSRFSNREFMTAPIPHLPGLLRFESPRAQT